MINCTTTPILITNKYLYLNVGENVDYIYLLTTTNGTVGHK